MSAQRSQIGIARVLRTKDDYPYGGERLVSVSLSNLRERMPGGRTQETLDVSAEIARPFAELRWMDALPGTSRAKRRWRNQRISLTSGVERLPGEALTVVFLAPRERRAP